jgi:hypothetical protein
MQIERMSLTDAIGSGGIVVPPIDGGWREMRMGEEAARLGRVGSCDDQWSFC